MNITMYIFNTLSIVLVQSACILTTVKAGHNFGLNVSTWNYDVSDVFSILRGGESLQNDLDGDWDIEEGCSCLNGKCEKLCVKEKNGVCRRTANVCVCPPEFFKVNDETCIFCSCGKGFNCTFYHTTRTCTCPEGFYIKDDKCVAMCGDSLPCQNRGECIDGKCKCKNGTTGSLCEKAAWCSEMCDHPLFADCVYNKEKDAFSCLCKDRSQAFDFDLGVCKPCLCGAGSCIYENNSKLTCKCDPGYEAFNGQCRQCNCGRDGICAINEGGEITCKCKDGDFGRGGKCLPCDCGQKDAKCQTNKEGRKTCICPYHYEDILGKCIKMNKDDRRCLCHPTANCIETFDDNEFNCTCKEGFRGKIHEIPHFGEECIDINECHDLKTCPDRETTECFNFEGSYMCRCKTGHQPVDMSVDPRKITCGQYKVSWVPTGVAIGIIIAFIAVSVGFLLYLRHRSRLSAPSSGIEMRFANLKR